MWIQFLFGFFILRVSYLLGVYSKTDNFNSNKTEILLEIIIFIVFTISTFIAYKIIDFLE